MKIIAPRQKLSSFSLKIIAMTTMFIDHFAATFLMLYLNNKGLWNSGVFLENLYFIMRFIGRIAFPLYLFMLSEGLFFTQNRKKYVLRLSYFAIGVYVLNTALNLIIKSTNYSQLTGYFHLNAFIDLLTYASLIFFLENENKKMRFFDIIPIAWLVFSYCHTAFFSNAMGNYSFILNGLTNDYSIYGLCLFLAFYLTKKHFFKKYQGEEVRLKALTYQLLFGALVIIIFTALFIGLSYAFYPGYLNKYGSNTTYAKWMASYKARDYTDSWMFNILWFPACLEGSFWGILSFPLILFYSGQLGYHKKWFRKFEYYFYPGHILILYMLMILLAELLR